MTDIPKVFPLFKRVVTPLPLTSKKPYQAFTLDSGRPYNLLIEGLLGDPNYRSVMSYSYLMEVISVRPEDISLIYTNLVVTLQGRNLYPLIEAFQEQKLRSIRRYIPEVHLEIPSDTLEPVIDQLYLQSIDQFWNDYFGHGDKALTKDGTEAQ